MVPCCKQIKFRLLGVAFNILDGLASSPLLCLMPAALSCQMFLGQVVLLLDSALHSALFAYAIGYILFAWNAPLLLLAG